MNTNLDNLDITELEDNTMFCHKCGANLSDTAEFCHKCGTKVVHANEPKPVTETTDITQTENSNEPIKENAASNETVNVRLISFSDHKMSVIKAVMKSMETTLAEAKDIVEFAPITLKKSVPIEEAELLKRVLTQAGAEIEFTDQNDKPIRAAIHCKNCGSELPDDAESCHSCGQKLDIPDKYKPDEPQKEILPHNWTEFKEYFKAMSLFRKIIAVFAACFGIILIVFAVMLIIVIFKLIFSSVVSAVITIAVVYIVYQKFGAVRVAQNAYNHAGNKLHFDKNMDSSSVFDALNGKFNYPYFKGIRYNEAGSCVIEGKYTDYTIVFREKGCAKLEYDITGKEEKLRLILREATSIHGYLNKFFDPELPYDAIKDFRKLKLAEKQQNGIQIAISTASAILIAVFVIYMVKPDIIKPGAAVRGSYLSQYSDKVTIEEAFDSFFAKEKWRTYKENGYSYVAFTGVCEFMEKSVDVRINFKITGDNFRVDSMDINGVEQGDLMVALLLEKIYEEYE